MYDYFYQAALHYEIDAIIRVAGDCPMIDPHHGRWGYSGIQEVEC